MEFVVFPANRADVKACFHAVMPSCRWPLYFLVAGFSFVLKSFDVPCILDQGFLFSSSQLMYE